MSGSFDNIEVLLSELRPISRAELFVFDLSSVEPREAVMRYTVRHENIVIGTVDLARGQFVAGRLTPRAQYAGVADIVTRATQAFLRIGLFYDVDMLQTMAPLDAEELLRSVGIAAQLRLMLVDSEERWCATHFVNLLEAEDDRGIVVLVSFVDAPDEARQSSGEGPMEVASVRRRSVSRLVDLR